jgi:hypothetical protein
MEKLTEEHAQKIFDSSGIPEDAKPVGMPAFAMYAEIDMTKQELRVVKPFKILVLSLPSGLPDQSQWVLIRLFRCFAKAGEVSEGLIGDMMAGFAEPTLEERPLTPDETWVGLRQLRAGGYLEFQTPDGVFIDEHNSRIGSSWVRYKPKLLELVYERADK